MSISISETSGYITIENSKCYNNKIKKEIE